MSKEVPFSTLSPIVSRT